MTQTISAVLLFMVVQAPTSTPQATTSQQRGSTTTAPPVPQTPTPQRGAPSPSQPQRGQRAQAKPPMPMTLRQVIESLITLKNSSRVEDQVSKAGVRFQATPAVLDILKEFGAGPRLLSLIPPPPAPPTPPAAKLAGPLTVICEPKDCSVAAGETFKRTSQNRVTLTGLQPGETTLEVFADGYERMTRRVQLVEGKPAEEKFSLKRSAASLQQSGSAALLKTVANLGGTDGFAELADIEGSGTMQWVNSDGKMEEWTLNFAKRVGKDLTTTFKTRNGECTASVVVQGAKQDCKGGLKNSGEKIAEQGASLFLSYQLQDVIQTLLRRPLVASETDDNRLESADAKDAYVFAIGSDGLPAGLIYRIADGNSTIQVEYSNYLRVADARYPGKVSIGRVNSAPVWIFTLNNVRSRIARRP